MEQEELKLTYEFFHFKLREQQAKTGLYGIHKNSSNSLTGLVKWDRHMYQYIVEWHGGPLTKKTMVNIIEFIDQLNVLRKSKKEPKSNEIKSDDDW